MYIMKFNFGEAGNINLMQLHTFKVWWLNVTPLIHSKETTEHTHHFRNFLLKYYGRVLICATNSTVQTLRAGSLFSTSGVLFTSSEGATLQFAAHIHGSTARARDTKTERVCSQATACIPCEYNRLQAIPSV